MDSNPSEWMSDKVAEWEQQQAAIAAARQIPAEIDETTTVQDSYEFLKKEVEVFRAEIGARAEYDARTHTNDTEPAKPVNIRKVEFMKENVEIFKEGVSKTLESDHKRTCSTCIKPKDDNSTTHTVEFMKEEVEKFKENMNM